MIKGNLILEERQGALAIIKLNRPGKRNALSADLVDSLEAAVDRADADDQVRIIILGAEGDHFCAGADISELVAGTPEGFFRNDLLDRGRERVAQTRKPVIAAVQGYAIGGGFEILLMCDLIVADRTTKFGCPEVGVGTLPGAGATQRLTRAVGYYKASELILRGRFFSGEEARDMGLVAELVDVDPLGTAIEVGEKMSALPLTALMLSKEAMRAALETPLSQGLRFERRLFHSSLSFRDLNEGAVAFSEKRRPNFNIDANPKS